MTVVQRIARNSLFQIVAFAFKALTGLVVSLAIARAAGVTLLGDFAAIMTLAGLLAFLTAFGLPELLTREIARLRSDAASINRLVADSLGLGILLSAVVIVLVLATALALGVSTSWLLALLFAAVGLAFESCATIIAATFRGTEEMGLSSAVATLMEVVFLVLALPVIAVDPTLPALMVAFAVSRLASLGLALQLVHARFGALRPALHPARYRELLRLGFPFSANNALSLIYVRIDVLFLWYLSGAAVVGLYEAATSLPIRVNILARTVNLSLFPYMSLRFVENVHSIRRYTARVIRHLMIPGCLIAAILWIFAREIVVLLYGEKFLGAVEAVRWLALIIPLRMIDNSIAVALTASNRQPQRSMALGVAAVGNVALNVVLIPRYQLMGAVYATVLTELLLCAFLLGFMRQEIRDVLPWQAFVAPALGLATMVVLAVVLEALNAWVLGTALVVVYVGVVSVVDRSNVATLRLLLRGGATR